jgi:glucose-6-phosphate 1-epimerase
MSLSVTQHVNDIQIYTITNGPSSATVYSYGAHMTHLSLRGQPLLFLSDRAILDGSKPIRGGIPLVFPQFGPGALPQHGFARNARFQLLAFETSPGTTPTSAPTATLSLQLTASDATRRVWDHDFVLVVRFVLGLDFLDMQYHVTNSGARPLDFTCAWHTYFAVAHATTVGVTGLRGVHYTDSLRPGSAPELEAAEPMRFVGEVDRVYRGLKAGAAVVLHPAPAEGHQVRMVSSGALPDLVVWNPHVEKTRKTADLAPSDWERFVCLESAAVSSPVVVEPQQTWSSSTVITLE